jgi:hypothetical protein
LDVGEPLVGSITVSADNDELYVVTASDVIQLIDNGDQGSRAWTAELTGFDGYANVDVQSNGLTATVTANGVVIMIGGGKKLFGKTLMLHVGMGLLDRETGKLRYFTEGREDSLAMSVVAADGSIYVAHSPLRRAVGKAMYPELTPDVTGGIARFKPIRLDLLSRDAICAAEARAANASTLSQATEQAAISTDIRQIKVLLKQADGAMTKALNDGDLSAEDASMVGNLMKKSSSNLTPVGLTESVAYLAKACAAFDL